MSEVFELGAMGLYTKSVEELKRERVMREFVRPALRQMAHTALAALVFGSFFVPTFIMSGAFIR